MYRKSSEEVQKERRRVSALFNVMEPSLLQFYVSRQWLNKFRTFAEPGPISNHDFLCSHGGDRGPLIRLNLSASECSAASIRQPSDDKSSIFIR